MRKVKIKYTKNDALVHFIHIIMKYRFSGGKFNYFFGIKKDDIFGNRFFRSETMLDYDKHIMVSVHELKGYIMDFMNIYKLKYHDENVKNFLIDIYNTQSYEYERLFDVIHRIVQYVKNIEQGLFQPWKYTN